VVAQQARQVAWTLAERAERVRFLINHDRKFTGGFDAVFEAENVQIVRAPIQVPEANGIAERFVRTARSECLDWLLSVNGRHLERALTVFINHYNDWRPHGIEFVYPTGSLSERRTGLVFERRNHGSPIEAHPPESRRREGKNP